MPQRTLQVEPLGVDDPAVDEVEALAEDRVEDAVLDEAGHLLLDHRVVADAPNERRTVASTVSRDVCSPGITSIIGIRCGGFDQCMPTTRSGWAQTVGDLRDRDARGVRGEDRVVGDAASRTSGTPRASARASPARPRARSRRPRAPRRGRSRSGAPPPSSCAASSRSSTPSRELDAALRAFERLLADVVERACRCPRGRAPRPCPGPSSPSRSPLRVVTSRPCAFLLQLLDSPPDALGRQRQLVHRDARVGERGHDRGGDGRERSLAAALRPVRSRARPRSRR